MFNSHRQVVLSQNEIKIILCNFNRVIKYLVCLSGNASILVRSRVVSLQLELSPIISDTILNILIISSMLLQKKNRI